MLTEPQRAVWGTNAPQVGTTPAIALINPKKADNVAKVVRLASCFGVSQVWWTGQRVDLDLSGKARLPREERMRGYRDVSMIQNDRFIDQFQSACPVAVEVQRSSESLLEFEHPENAVYVFGPEDGSITKPYLRHCHRFVVIPSRHCLNLATAVSVILWDRYYKFSMAGKTDTVFPGEWESRGPERLGLRDRGGVV